MKKQSYDEANSSGEEIPVRSLKEIDIDDTPKNLSKANKAVSITTAQ